MTDPGESIVGFTPTEGTDVDTLIFMGTWMSAVTSEVPANAYDMVVMLRRLRSVYLDHVAFLSLLNLTGEVLSMCCVVSWPHSAQMRQSGVKEEDQLLPDGKG